MRTYKIGQKVRMTSDALDNYGEKYENTLFKITLVATSVDDHPGYDEGVGNQALYDLFQIDTKTDLPFSLYDWELQTA